MIFGGLYMPVAMKLQYLPLGELLNVALTSVLPLLVCVGFWVWKGATPGKMLTGLKVVRADTLEPLGWGRATARFLAYNLSFLTCAVGFIWAGWDARKQALHDHVADTVVVHSGDSKSSSVMAVLLGAAAALAILVAAGGFFAVRWFNDNKDRLRAEGDALKAEARLFGRAHTQAESLHEGLRRLDACSGIICEAKTGIFVEAALAESSPSDGFCASVPPDDSILATALWRVSACDKIGRGGQQPCGRLMGAVQKHCAAAVAGGGPVK